MGEEKYSTNTWNICYRVAETTECRLWFYYMESDICELVLLVVNVMWKIADDFFNFR